MSELCLTLLCPPALEEKLLDLLLMAPETSLYTSTTVAAHGLSFGRLRASEQVMGRAKATQIQVLLEATQKAALLQALQSQFAGAGLRYWFAPITEMGSI